MIFAVFLPYVLKNLITTRVIKVNVDIRLADSLGIEESLEDQIVLDRIDVCDIQKIRRQAPGGRTASGPDDDAVVLRPIYQILHNEKVSGKSCFLDNIELK